MAKNTLWVSQPPGAGTISTDILNFQKKPTANGRWKTTIHGMDFRDGWRSSSPIRQRYWKSRDTNGDGKADEETKVVKNRFKRRRSLVALHRGEQRRVFRFDWPIRATFRMRQYQPPLEIQRSMEAEKPTWSSGIRNTETRFSSDAQELGRRSSAAITSAKSGRKGGNRR